jgi:hypothetical protein
MRDTRAQLLLLEVYLEVLRTEVDSKSELEERYYRIKLIKGTTVHTRSLVSWIKWLWIKKKYLIQIQISCFASISSSYIYCSNPSHSGQNGRKQTPSL